MGNRNFKVTVDTSDIGRGKKEVKKFYEDIANEAEKSGGRIDEVFRSASKAATTFFSVAAAKRFSDQIINVRGEMQMLEASFETLLSSSTKSAEMIKQIKDYAVESPLSISGISKAAQTLMGFNVEAEKVIPIIKQIGDISMGNQERFQSLTLAFAQMSSTGKLMGQDLLQMINAGFNPLSEMSLKTGKSISELKDEMANGAISSEMVADAFRSATEAGGKFYGMTQKQAEGIRGLQAQLQGAWQDMFNNLGKSQEGFIAEGYKGVISLVKNYERVGTVIASIAVTFGAYKAAVIAVNMVLKEQAAINAMVAASNGVFNKSLAAQWLWTERVQKAQKLLNKTMLTNPYVLAATAVAGLAASIYLYATRATDAEKAAKLLNDQLEKQNDQLQREGDELRSLIDVIKDETSTRLQKQTALEQLKRLMPDVFQNLDIEGVKTSNLTEVLRQYNEQQEKALILERKRNLKRAKELSDSKEGSFRWTWSERKEALELMGKDTNFWNISNFTGKNEQNLFKEWIAAQEENLKELEELSNKAKDIVIEPVKTDASTKTDTKKKKADEAYNAELDIEEARIRAMSEGYEKEVARVNFIHQQRLDHIRKRAKELTDEQQLLMTMYANTERDSSLKLLEYNQLEELKDQTLRDQAAWNEYLQKYGDYQEKRLGITREYEQKIKDAQTGGEKALLQKQMEDALKEVDFENFKATIDFEKIFSNIDEHSTEALTVLRDKIALYLEQASESLTPEQLKVLGDAFGSIDLTIRNRDPFGSIVDSVKKYRKALEELKSAQDNGFAPEQVKKYSDAVNAAMLTVTANVENAANEAREYTNILTGVMSSTGKGEAANDVNNYANLALGAVQAGSGMARVFAGDLSGIKDAAKGLAQVAASIVAINDQAKEREIAKLQEKVDSLKKTYEDLGKAIETSYSKSAANLIREQDKALRQRAALIEMQIKEEEAKKKTDKNRIQEWRNELDKINESLKDTEDQIIDVIMGDNVKSAIDNFAKAYTDAWGAGEDKMLSVKDSVKKMIQGVISEMVKSNISDAVTKFRQKLAAAIEDDYISASEEDELNAIMESITRDNERKFAWADRFMKNSSSTTEQGAASYGAYDKITQDQASSIDGRLTGIFQVSVENSSSLKEISKNTSDLSGIGVGISELRNLALDSWSELVSINKNTKLLHETNQLLTAIKKNTSEL